MSVEEVLTKSDDKFLDESYDVTISGGNILLTGWRDGHNHIYLYGFDPANPLSGHATLTKQLTSGDWEVAEISAVDPVNANRLLPLQRGRSATAADMGH